MSIMQACDEEKFDDISVAGFMVDFFFGRLMMVIVWNKQSDSESMMWKCAVYLEMYGFWERIGCAILFCLLAFLELLNCNCKSRPELQLQEQTAMKQIANVLKMSAALNQTPCRFDITEDQSTVVTTYMSESANEVYDLSEEDDESPEEAWSSERELESCQMDWFFQE